MPVLGCGAEMAKLMDVSDQDVQTIEDVIQERLDLGVSQAVAQRHAVAEALAQLSEERSMVMKAIDEQLGKPAANEPVVDAPAKAPAKAPVFSRKQTETPEFKRWFGKSKVVDAEGKPLVVYHATESGRVAENMGAEEEGVGIDRFYEQTYFSANPKEAESYAMSGTQVYPVYLAIKNPYETSNYDEFAEAYAGLADELSRSGYDGIIYRAPNESPQFLAFRPEQIKSAIGNSGQFDPANPDIRFSRKANPVTNLYSALAEEVSKINAKAQPADGWKQQIKGLVAKGAVKADEVEWTGLNEWLDLQEGRVTKEAVQEFLDANGVQVQETQLGNVETGPQLDAWLEKWSEANDGETSNAIYNGQPWTVIQRVAKQEGHQDVIDRIAAKVDGAEPKYAQYTLPGGENYREVLLTLPSETADQRLKRWKQKYPDWKEGQSYRKVMSPDDQSRFEAELEGTKKDYRSSHWDQPNVLAHLRVNDRTDADGKRVLFVEEIQSDWGQEGKKRGFKQGLQGLSPQEEYRFQGLLEDGRRNLRGDDLAEFESLLARRDAAANDRQAIPAAPFVTKTDAWVNLALKRIITMAVQEGYDKVAFVNGEQSADRYDLSKQVDSIHITKLKKGGFEFTARQDGREIISRQTVPDADALAGAVGKDLAEKANGQELDSGKTYAGIDLKVGGEGMKAFYNQIVPAAVKKLVPKLGGEPGLVDVSLPSNVNERDQGAFQIEQDIDTPFNGEVTLRRRMPDGSMQTIGVMSREEAYNYTDDPKNHTGQIITQPGFTITDAMREKASQGLPMFSRKQRPAPLAEETKFEELRRKMQDQYLHLEKIQNVILANGGTIGEQQNTYRAEERSHGRKQEKLRDFNRNLLEPMVSKAAKYGIEMHELSAYAYAKHAKERNAEIDKINPAMNGMGSGMDDATADNIIQMVKLTGDEAKFEELHQDLMRIAEATRQEYLRSGLISQEDYDDWTGKYRNYVPLKGFENVDDEGNVRPGVGTGLSIKGKETLRALGRRTRAGGIVSQMVADHDRAVTRAETNAVAKTFLNMVTTNPDPALWEVQPRKLKARMGKNGLVAYHQTPDTEGTIGVKVAGQQVYVKIHDPLLLRAMTSAGKDKSGELHGFIVRTLGAYTNLLRNTLTRYNPLFGALNLMKDAPMGAIMAFDELGGKGAKLYAKYYGQALVASGFHEAGKPRLNKDMDRYLKEMRMAGGTTGGIFMRDVEDVRGDLRMAMILAGVTQPKTLREKMMARSRPAAKGAQALGKALEFIGATSEDAARLAAYRAARELGKTPAEAASIAKNLTTNFNRSGEWGAGINALYLFFNAGVQGTTRLAQALKNPKVRYLMGAISGASMGLALMGAAMGGDDDDGVPYWDQIPQHEKERNLIIMLTPGMEMDGAETVGKAGRYVKIPVQYGLNIFTTFGYQMADVARNVKDPAQGVSIFKAAANMASVAAGSINPFGGALDITDPVAVGLAAVPTTVATAGRMALGLDGFNRPVGVPRAAGDTRPDSELYSASQAGGRAQQLAAWMNEYSGGNAGRSGRVDIQPGSIENLGRVLGGGLGDFVMKTLLLADKAINVPETIEDRDVPFWRNIQGDLDSVAGMTRYYDRSKKALDELHAAEREDKLGIDVEYTPEQLALQDLGELAKQSAKELAALRKEEIEIALDESMPRAQKALERRRLRMERARVAKDFNSEYATEMARVARGK